MRWWSMYYYEGIDMPFKSKSQMRWMFSKHPKMAKRWAKEQEKEKGKKSFKRLPEKKKRKKKHTRDDMQLFEPILRIEE